MAAGRGGVGSVVDIALRVFFRARFFVLGLFVLIAAVCLFEAILHSPARSLICLAVACAVFSISATIHLRHGGLGALVAIAPLPGVLAGYAAAASRAADT